MLEDRLPPREAFYDDLSRNDITDEAYEFAQKVWETFNCKTLQDYMEIYLLADVLLLCDVFESFRSNCLSDYELDPVHYFSSAHFTFDAFLRKSRANLELLSDINQYLFFRKGIRGGMSMVCKRFSVANNKYMGSTYDSSMPSKYIIDLDCNNLYGRAMLDYLPVGGFTWVEPRFISLKSLLHLPPDAEYGYILDVSFSYPSSLHDYHADYPLAPTKTKTPFSSLSPVAKTICLKHNLRKSTGAEKLVASFDPKLTYVLHYRNLQLYVKLGLKIEQIHRGIMFKQAPVMREYVAYNSEKRAAATNEFDVGFYKLLSNSLFGKTIERPDNRSKVRLVSKIASYEKCVSDLNFKSAK